MQCQLFDTISSWSTDSLVRTSYVFDQMPTYYYTVWTVSVFVSGSKALMTMWLILSGRNANSRFTCAHLTITGSKTLDS